MFGRSSSTQHARRRRHSYQPKLLGSYSHLQQYSQHNVATRSQLVSSKNTLLLNIAYTVSYCQFIALIIKYIFLRLLQYYHLFLRISLVTHTKNVFFLAKHAERI